MIAIDVLKWPGMNQAFLVSFLGSIVLVLLVIPYGKRRPKSRPVSWGEAMLGATYAFLVSFLALGVAPHQWIDHADRNLGWDKAKILYGPGGIFKSQAEGGWFPFTLQYEAVRDTVVVLIHVVFLALTFFIWSWWQKRDQKKVSTEVATSPYGRPLVKKA